jgi:hypothetical protein
MKMKLFLICESAIPRKGKVRIVQGLDSRKVDERMVRAIQEKMMLHFNIAPEKTRVFTEKRPG